MQNGPIQRTNDEVDFGTLAKTIIVYHNGERLSLAEHLEKELTRSVAGVMRMGKAATITFTLTAKPSTEESSVDFSALLKVVVPEPAARATTLYATKEGRVYPDDPRQQTIQFQDPNARKLAEVK